MLRAPRYLTRPRRLYICPFCLVQPSRSWPLPCATRASPISSRSASSLHSNRTPLAALKNDIAHRDGSPSWGLGESPSAAGSIDGLQNVLEYASGSASAPSKATSSEGKKVKQKKKAKIAKSAKGKDAKDERQEVSEGEAEDTETKPSKSNKPKRRTRKVASKANLTPSKTKTRKPKANFYLKGVKYVESDSPYAWAKDEIEDGGVEAAKGPNSKATAEVGGGRARVAKLTKKEQRAFDLLKATEAPGSETAVKGISLKEALKGEKVEDGESILPDMPGVCRVKSSQIEFTAIDVPQLPVPGLSYGLDRVLFNPGVYQLQDRRSRVYNFDPYLKNIMPVNEFEFNSLKEYITSSRDTTLIEVAKQFGKKYVGSTSSMTGVLSHFHYLLSRWRGLNLKMLSQGFPEKLDSFTQLNRAPSAIFLRWRDGTYAIDADKEFDSANVLSMLGKSMEKLLTLPKEEYERYRKNHENPITEEERLEPESYHYSTLGDFIMRSQLDAYDPRLPGTGMYDLKTRAVVSIRHDVRDFEPNMGYQIRYVRGQWESFEREYYDMMRSTMLKYSLQARMGRMDGIFLAYHNIETLFGFQYIPISEIDVALHGQNDRCLGDKEFKISLYLLNEILNRATDEFPGETIRFHFETRDAKVPFMYIFAEPMSDEKAQQLQDTNKAAVEDYERRILGLDKDNEATEEVEQWQDIKSFVEEEVETDELSEDMEQQEDATAEVLSKTEAIESAAGESTVSTSEVNPIPQERGQVQVDESQDSKQEQSAVLDTKTELMNSDQRKENVDKDAVKVSAPKEKPQSPIPVIEPVPEDSPRRLLAMTLTIRNRVNGEYVPRPETLKPSHKWQIEYSLTVIPSEKRASALYNASMARRRKKFQPEESENDEEKALSYYQKILREMSKRGKDWREKQDRREENMEKIVYRSLDGHEGFASRRSPGEESEAFVEEDEDEDDDDVEDEEVEEHEDDEDEDGKHEDNEEIDSDEDDEEEDIESVDEYLEWLYSNEKKS